MRHPAVSFAFRSSRGGRGPRGQLPAAAALLASALCASAAVAVPSGEGGETDRAAEIEAAVGDLADDEVRWNAQRAMQKLREIGEPAVPALRAALDSPDWQQRQLAASVLRKTLMERPSERLLEATVAGLRDDVLPVEREAGHQVAWTPVSNASEGVAVLVKHARRAEPFLADGLRSDDNQQRFLSAAILGAAGLTCYSKSVAEILLPHLRDNDIPKDAVVAVSALHGLGKPVIPFLQQARHDADRQQAKLIDLLILDLTRPPKNERELRQRQRMQDITSLADDPAIQSTITSFRHGPMLWHAYFSSDDPPFPDDEQGGH